MGGMQALTWAVEYPDTVGSRSSLPLPEEPPRSIAYNEVMRRAIATDPQWNSGDYYCAGPGQRTATARILHDYLSKRCFHDAQVRARFCRQRTR